MDDTCRTVTIIPAKSQMDQRTVMRQLRVAAYCRVSTEEELDSTICKVGTMTPLSVDLLVRMPIFLQAGGLLVAICLHTASLTSVSFPAARFKLLCNPIRYAFVCKDA